MHLSFVLVTAVGLAGITFAAPAPDPPATTAKPSDCTYTSTYKWTHGLTHIVKEYSSWTTRSMTVDCHGCNAIVQRTVFIKHGGGYTNRAGKTRTIPPQAGVVGTKVALVCRTSAPEAAAANKPAVQAKPAPTKLSWKGASKLPPKDAPVKEAPANDAP
ncbi:uncharacterized protein DFL_002060 [Arthrobotrys flagrans]|uniref:Uncharacterized protein n=1 Tax=Arthrobotrys flagrans TaxID=97331 RepID=A0A437A9F8_ARTFL|nr:hypothetical protein DFL_002060 [Arthrobotrys flagrans]